MVPRCMSSTIAANIATAFKIKGLSYSISSACSTSAHCIGNGSELIQMGKQDVVLAGGGEELHWTLTVLFDAMGALSSRYNDTPERASRPYDANRDGFVISGGGGVVVLEELEHAKARGARIYGEVTGYAATSDGADMVAPSGEGAVRCMRLAMKNLGNTPIDYVNSHGTSTPAGDIIELNAMREVFGADLPKVSSTKSLTGHSQGATGVHEAIYSLIMMEQGFVAPSANIEELDPEAEGFPLVREAEPATLNCVMSNSFGFGGTNASLTFSRIEG
jgi:3-oxoacyl-[acyl-carrier-protein] synthase-1